jgi:hypothetical protein
MTPFDFIFMLTRNDRTVADAAVHAETALRAGIRDIGFKDVGLPFDALAGLARQIREGSMSKLGRWSGRNGESRNLVVVDSHGRVPSGEQVAQCAI